MKCVLHETWSLSYQGDNIPVTLEKYENGDVKLIVARPVEGIESVTLENLPNPDEAFNELRAEVVKWIEAGEQANKESN